MQLKEAKKAVELGAVGGFRAVRNVKGKGWSLHILGKGVGQQWMLETVQGDLRLFSSLDTLVGVAESIGGREFEGCDLWVLK